MSQTIIYVLSILPLLYITSMTFCPQLAHGTISLTSDWVLGDDSKQYRCYIGKIVKKKKKYYSGQNTSFKVELCLHPT